MLSSLSDYVSIHSVIDSPVTRIEGDILQLVTMAEAEEVISFRDAILQHDFCRAEQLWASGQLSNAVPVHVSPVDSETTRPTLLHVTATLGHTNCLQVLLAHSDMLSMLNQQDALGWSPLMYAIANRHEDTVDLLLDVATCDVNVQDSYLQTPLHIEAQAQGRSTHIATRLVELGALIDAEDIMGLTPFLRAVEANNFVVCEFLFSKDCDIHIAGYDRRTALHIAALHHHEQLLEWLLGLGLRPLVNTLDHNFQTALMLCLQHKTAPQSAYRIIKRLLQAGVRINQQDCHGNTALLLSLGNPSAIKWNHVELLLDAGCDPNIPNREGLTPIWQAVYDGIQYPDRQKIIQILVRYNCYLNMSCRGKLLFTSGLNSVYCYETFMSPLEVALNSGYYDAAKTLLLAGCQIHKDLRYDKAVSLVPEELAWFQNFLENTQSLQHLCRLVIRKVLGTKIQMKISQLPLPCKVKNYLLLQDCAELSNIRTYYAVDKAGIHKP